MTPQLQFILKIVFFIFLKNIATRNEVKRFFGRYQQRAFEKSNSPAIYSLSTTQQAFKHLIVFTRNALLCFATVLPDTPSVKAAALVFTHHNFESNNKQ